MGLGGGHRPPNHYYAYQYVSGRSGSGGGVALYVQHPANRREAMMPFVRALIGKLEVARSRVIEGRRS